MKDDGVFARDMRQLCPAPMPADRFKALAEVGRADRIDRLFRDVTPDSFAAMPEADRLAVMNRAAAVPAACGPDIPVAPARHAFRVFRPIEMVPGSEGRFRDAGYRGPGEDRPRAAVILSDVFDRMEAQARRRYGGDQMGFVAPFTPGQVQIARDYRGLVERHSAGGVRCVSLETTSRKSGGGGEFIDAFVAEGQRLDAMRARIGTGIAMAVRRVRPSARGIAEAVAIRDRLLVDAVCLKDKDLTWVLKRSGWAANQRNRDVLRKALCAALDRMMGYGRGTSTR